ncbi:MAG TPA: GIY-YIG nuclease family protein [Flavobacteriales bacterium]|nr:GIY-YIG nuclease family protein [Flavobacteriales bacterium]
MENQTVHSVSDQSSLARIRSIGLVHAGIWKLNDPIIEFSLMHGFPDRDDVLYAFVIEESVKYVGITSKRLSERMGQYAKPYATQSTNIRLKEFIRDSLKSGIEVSVYALPSSLPIHVGEFPLNIAAGIEYSLIERLDPDWNTDGRSKKLREPVSDL